MELTLDGIVAQLTGIGPGGLPGPAAHARLMPSPRAAPAVPGPAVPTGALVLLFERDGLPHVLLTRRSPRLSSHAGQISFPGGRREPGESAEDAALREGREEVGLDPDRVRMVAALTSVTIPVSGFRLDPRIGVARGELRWVPDPGEVEEILEVPLPALVDPRALAHERRIILGTARSVPGFRVRGHTIWGATGMVLSELLWILGHPPGGDQP